MRPNRTVIIFRLSCLGLAALTVMNSGCILAVAGATAAGAAAGYAVYEDGEVVQRYDATYRDVHSAVLTALAELGMPVVSDKSGNDNTGTIVSKTSDDDRIAISLETKVSRVPADGPVTRVAVRVATWGDRALSNRVFDQINRHLIYVRPVATTAPLTPIPTGVVPAVAQVPAAPPVSQSPPPPLSGK